MRVVGASGVHDMATRIHSATVLECRITRRVGPEDVDAEARARLEQRARRQDLDFDGDDLAGAHLLITKMGVDGSTRPG
jgi:hypothetical protein